MKGPAVGPAGEDITLPDQVAPRGPKASSTRNLKSQTSKLKPLVVAPFLLPPPHDGYVGR